MKRRGQARRHASRPLRPSRARIRASKRSCSAARAPSRRVARSRMNSVQHARKTCWPLSTSTPSISNDVARPPRRRLRSKELDTDTGSLRRRAAERPASPAPTTATRSRATIARRRAAFPSSRARRALSTEARDRARSSSTAPRRCRPSFERTQPGGAECSARLRSRLQSRSAPARRLCATSSLQPG